MSAKSVYDVIVRRLELPEESRHTRLLSVD